MTKDLYCVEFLLYDILTDSWAMIARERQEQGMYSLDEVRNVDPEIAQAIVDEQNRQNSHIELIASENWVSKAVMAAMGSPLTN